MFPKFVGVSLLIICLTQNSSEFYIKKNNWAVLQTSSDYNYFTMHSRRFIIPPCLDGYCRFWDKDKTCIKCNMIPKNPSIKQCPKRYCLDSTNQCSLCKNLKKT